MVAVAEAVAATATGQQQQQTHHGLEVCLSARTVGKQTG